MHGRGYAVTTGIMTNFPRSVLTVSLWMRSSDVSSLSTIMSYVQMNNIHSGDNLTTSTAGMTSERWQEFAIQDQRNIKVILQDYLYSEFEVEYDYVNAGREGRRTSNIGTLNDGAWHFLSVSWSGATQEVHVYVDTALRYTNTIRNKKISTTLSSTGMLAIGASIRGNCQQNNEMVLEDSTDRGVCGLVDGTHFVGSIQGVRVWGVELTETQRALEMQVRLLLPLLFLSAPKFFSFDYLCLCSSTLFANSSFDIYFFFFFFSSFSVFFSLFAHTPTTHTQHSTHTHTTTVAVCH